MKKVQKLLLAVLMLFMLFAGAVHAENHVCEIDIDVRIRHDGSAAVVQTWDGTFYEGTENYIPIATGDISISDFSVSDAYGTYTYTAGWDIHADFDAKARKCGICETEDGVELCFGISQYGENTYKIQYVIEDFIKSYTDYDGVNYMFINPFMSTFPTDAAIRVSLDSGAALDESCAGIWAFGFQGDIAFENGTVRAWSTSALEDEDAMIVMLQLEKGLVFPKTHVEAAFDSVKDRAFEGSDYGYEEEGMGILGYIFVCIMFLLLLVIVIATVVFWIRRKSAIKKFYKEAGYFRDVPNGGKIEVSYYLAQSFDVTSEKSLLIGALLLQMINKGCIEPQTEENVGFFGKVKQSVNLKLVREPEAVAEKTLYQILLASAGADGILQEKELEKYTYAHPEVIDDLIDRARDAGETAFAKAGGFENGAGNCIKDLSESGKTELAEVMGMKKYLEEFTLIAEREITETVIWKDYMVYATLFGIADKVMQQLKQLYPEQLPEIEAYNRNVYVAHSYYRSMHRSSQRAMQQRRTRGGGGRASIGGGGGFSGGGRGGGSR